MRQIHVVVCPKCGEMFDRERFYGYCRACHTLYQRKWRAERRRKEFERGYAEGFAAGKAACEECHDTTI